ncbi:MAG TPA: methyl-accepting chemotaxis protein [Candidatus Competibacter sp.]|nr:methyl-accepting chemotaxis protein [Candidatus Competibacter sp.]
MNANNLKIGTRLTIGFGMVATIALLLGVLAMFGIYTMSMNMENIGGNWVPALQALAQINRERMVIRSQTQAVFAYETQADARESLHAIQEERRKSWQRVDQGWEALLKIPHTSEHGLQMQLQDEYKAWRAIYVELDGLVGRLANAVDASERTAQYAEYRQLVGRMVPISDAMGKTFDAITENNLVRTNEMIQDDRAMADKLAIWAIVATAFGIILAAALGYLITRSVTKPLRRGSEVLSVLADGDMSHEVPAELVVRKDEVGDLARAMKTMSNQLKDMVGKVVQATSQVNSSAAEIAQGSGDLAQRTEEQASALEETASSMEELTSTVKQSAENAGQANQLASAARAQAEQGGQVVDQAVTAMSAIHQSSKKIADIIGVIDEIAFQTNLGASQKTENKAR